MANTVPPFPKIHEGRDEAIVDPDVEIVDAHQHLFDRPHLRYMLPDYLRDAGSGHRIVASVYVETQAMARATGPEALRPVGEVEFATGVAAMAASGVYGPCMVAAALVGFADMTLGDGVAATLDAELAAAPERLRGVRQIALAHPDPAKLRFLTHKAPDDLLKHPGLRPALAQLGRRGLSFDVTVLHHQLPEVAALADAYPDVTFVLDHLGQATPAEATLGGRRAVFGEWRHHLHALARRGNVVCKVGGLGTSYWGFGFITRTDPVGSPELAATWRPYVEAAVEAFGVDRCMMQSNYPNDGRSAGFVPLWNALKTITLGCSDAEKRALYRGTAERVYRPVMGWA